MSDLSFSGNDLIFGGNEDDAFDSAIESRLGAYVYALCDPRDKKVFYVGKAGGAKAQGNERIFSHFHNARQALRENSRQLDQKTRRIIEIWSADEQVEWYIVRHGLPDEATALHVEAALIDLLGVSQNGPALNLVRGHGTSSHGILTAETVRAFCAKPLAPTCAYSAVFIFPIQNAVARGEDVYQATRKAWAVSESFRKMQGAVAVGVANGIAKGVFSVDNWAPYGLRPSATKDSSNGAAPVSGKERSTQLWEFVGKPVADSELVDCDFSGIIGSAMGYWQRGNYLVVRLGNSNGKKFFKFLRGSAEKAVEYEL